jgi:tetratricopeptide (TPR) repeat protein
LSRRLRALFIFLLPTLPAVAARAATPDSADWRVERARVDLRLTPRAGRIAVKCDIDIRPVGERTSTIDFLLNKRLQITSLEVNGADVRWTVEAETGGFRLAPDARRVTLPAPGVDPLRAPHEVRLELEYEGEIAHEPGSLSRVSPGLTELNIYGAWLPLFEGPQGFTYDLRVTAPAGHRVLSTGLLAPAGAGAGAGERAGEEGDGESAGRVWHHRLLGDSSAGDLPVIAVSSLRPLTVVPTRSCDVEIFATDLPAGVGERISEEAAWACEFLAGRAGREYSPQASSPGLGRVRLRIVVVPRDAAGYARPPLVVLPAGWFTRIGIDALSSAADESEWRRRLYHEMAHAFTPLADTRSYHDWMNEGLAEYLTLEALAARRGPAVAASYIRSYILDLAARPPAHSVRSVPHLDGPGPGQSPAHPPADSGGSRPPPATGAAEPARAGSGTDAPAAGRIGLAAISATRRGDPDATLLYYRKGALIFRLLAETLETEQFARMIASLRREYAPASHVRMSTEDLVAALERRTGASYAWLRRDWVDDTGLPRLEGSFRVRRFSSAEDGLSRGAFSPGAEEGAAEPGASFLVEGEILQAAGLRFRSPVPLEARGKIGSAVTFVRLSGPRTPVEWVLPFEPRALRIDPERIVPRIDPTVEEALLLLETVGRATTLAREGLLAERAGNFRTSLEKYEEAAALDPHSPFPSYRRGRVLASLDRPKDAIKSHRQSLRLADRIERERRRLRERCEGLPAMACDVPEAWLDPALDLRAWNWIRIGQMQERRGRQRSARRAFERALEMPDLAGAHDEARRALVRPEPGRP